MLAINPFVVRWVQGVYKLKNNSMNLTIKIFALVAIFFVGSSFTTATQGVNNWTKLGSKKVSYKLDRDVIRVGAHEGTFKKLKVVVTGGSLNMHKMVVEYGNGSKDNIPLKHNFSKRSDSRVIDLQGNNRVIKDITFWYDTKNKSRRKAQVHVFGKR